MVAKVGIMSTEELFQNTGICVYIQQRPSLQKSALYPLCILDAISYFVLQETSA